MPAKAWGRRDSRGWLHCRVTGPVWPSAPCVRKTGPRFARPADPVSLSCPGYSAPLTYGSLPLPTLRRSAGCRLPPPKLGDVPQVLAVGAGEQVMSVGAGHEIEVGHLGGIQRRLDAAPAGRIDRPRRQAGMEIGVVGRGELIVLLVQPALSPPGGKEDGILDGRVGLERHP